ncbi:MAG: hypothetical protein ACPG8W_20765 [Candidatus Promineifilaceae bacterium]
MSSINLNALCNAYENGTWSRRFYLDVHTGTVVTVTEAERMLLQDLYDEFGEDSAEIPPPLQQAHAVELDDERFLKVPACPQASLATLRDNFSETVSQPLRRLLWRALDANDGAGFERMLGLESAELKRWHTFKQAAFETTLNAWLSKNKHETRM